jgi:putative endopeptidase
VDHVTKMFVLLGDSQDKAAEEAKSVMSIETALAKGAIDRVELRDPAKRYHIMTVAELQALSPGYDWPAYLKGVKIGEFKTLNVATPTYRSRSWMRTSTSSQQRCRARKSRHRGGSAAHEGPTPHWARPWARTG